MKRSQINKIIKESIGFTEELKFPLPDFARFSVEDWENLDTERREIVDNMMGWDVTDFGSDDFEKIGLTIFTFRNGNFNDKEKYPKPYAEKMLIVEEGQTLPFHFHWHKMEDIINRGGGDLELTLYNADENNEFANTDVNITIDGRKTTLRAGEKVILKPGQSVTLKPYQYHSWTGVPGTGKVMLFEVSTTNDDRVDNYFKDYGNRLPEIEEDVDPEYLIFADYHNYVKL